MESPSRRGRRDMIQNIAIAVLSLSAVLLFAQSQIYNLVSEQSVLTGQLPGAAGEISAQTAVLTAPVRVAVTGAYDRYGACLTTDAEAFSELGLLLKESLGSAGTLAPCQARDFVSALEQVSVYYDFLSPLPLSILSELVGGEGVSSHQSIYARQMILSAAEGGVRLYTWDGDATYLTCQVPPLSADDLSEAVNHCSFSAAAFAFDRAKQDAIYSQIAPQSLLLAELPELPVLSAGNSLASTDSLLVSLGFNPSTKNRYTDRDGTETVRETDRSLQVESSGAILYQSGAEPAVEIDAAGPVPTLLEAADGVFSLLRELLEDQSGAASLYLESVEQSGENTTLRFQYHADGIPIYFSDGSAAAEVLLTGTSVTELSLRFRQYTASGEISLVLPLQQALAIAAADHPGEELSVGYADNGSSVSAQWITE